MKITRSSQVAWADALKKGKFSQRKKQLGNGKVLSASIWELAPGKKSFPFHGHFVTEEALYILSGRAKVRTPEGESPIGPGDFVEFPAGAGAHQLINDGTEPLVYLGMSANAAGVDIVEYPDSGKLATLVGKFPTGTRHIFELSKEVEYFAGEKDFED